MWNCYLSKESRHQQHHYSHQSKPRCSHRHLLLRKSLKSLKSQSPLRKVAESLRSRSSRSKPLLKIQRRHSRNKMGSATLNPNATPEPKHHLNSFVRRVDSHSMLPKNLGVTCLKHILGPVPATLRRWRSVNKDAMKESIFNWQRFGSWRTWKVIWNRTANASPR